jgi:L-asparaginase/Glu-tRNA(Gln) amidotransferase subunit D
MEKVEELEAKIQVLEQRVMMLESENILYDELLKLAKNVDDALGVA